MLTKEKQEQMFTSPVISFVDNKTLLPYKLNTSKVFAVFILDNVNLKHLKQQSSNMVSIFF